MLLPPEVEALIPTLGSLPMAVIITDCNGFARWANAHCAELTGYAADEIVGQNAAMHSDGEDATHRLHDVLHHVFADGKSWRGESGGKCKNGEHYEIELTISPIRNRLDSVTHALWTLLRLAAHDLSVEALRDSERRYRAIFESSRDALFIADSQTGMLIDANPAAQTLIGRSLEEIRSFHQTQLHPPEDALLSRANFERDRREPGVTIHNVVRSDGRLIPVEIVGNWMRDTVGRELILGAFRDITERRRAEEELRATQANYRLLIEQADDGIFLTDSDGRFVVVNPGICKMLGYTAEEMYQLNVLDTYLPEEQHLGRHRLSVIQSGHSVRFERSMRRKDGTALPVEASARRLEGGGLQAIIRNIAERKQAEENYRTLFREMLDGFALHEILCNEEGRPIDYRYLAVNPAFERLTGLKANHILGKTVLEVLAGTEQHWIETFGNVALTGKPAFFENFHAGLNKHFEVTAFRPAPNQFACIFADITERKLLEARFQQAQKMESIGRLAGGIAHDFNNLLTVINGYSEMLLAKLSAGDRIRADVGEILKAGERAAGLTQQLLAYSRKQVLQLRELAINRVVEAMLPMLRRLMGEDVEVRVALNAGEGMVQADPHQLEQVVMNLAVNSRDAMPGGGKLLIETAKVELDEDFVQAHPGAQVGRFVTLVVSDTGVGMDAETLRNIFEPFFTTKGLGKGTGLGLSMVYGIVKQSGGYIGVHSEPGHGTTFKIYLPQVEESHTIADVPVVAPPHGGTETVLVVEDQPEVLNYAVNALSAFGYRVVKAEDVREALRVFEQERGCIDLVLTDVMMPDRSGRDLADELGKRQPGIKVLFMSGYTDDTTAHHGVLEEGADFIQKPFSPEQLATKVRMVLGQ